MPIVDKESVKKVIFPSMRKLEKFSGTEIALNLTRVLLDARSGSFSFYSSKAVPHMEVMLNAFKLLNPAFDYRVRSIHPKEGNSLLGARQRDAVEQHKIELAKIENMVEPSYAKDNTGAIIFYYNRQEIAKREEWGGIDNLVDSVIGLKDFYEFVNFSPAIQPRTPEIEKAEALIGHYLDTPPCCIDAYPATNIFNMFLEEKYQKFISFVPCRPTCNNAIRDAELSAMVCEAAGLNIGELKQLVNMHFYGLLFVDAEKKEADRLQEEVSKFGGLMMPHSIKGNFVLRVNSRKHLTELYRKLEHVYGKDKLKANTVIPT
jgi:hypothetical protein